MEGIVLHVSYTCRPGTARAFVEALKESGCQAAVRAEDGCLQYDYHISCEQPDTVLLLERWRDAAALEEHQRHMEKIQAIKAAYVTEVRAERYE